MLVPHCRKNELFFSFILRGKGARERILFEMFYDQES
jgi:hypothetical protein